MGSNLISLNRGRVLMRGGRYPSERTSGVSKRQTYKIVGCPSSEESRMREKDFCTKCATSHGNNRASYHIFMKLRCFSTFPKETTKPVETITTTLR